MASPSVVPRKRARGAQSTLHGKYFSTAAQYASFKKNFAHRPIMEPTFIDIEFLTDEGFEICSLLGQASVLQLTIMEEPFADNLVRAFFCTMTFEDDILKATVKGKSLIVPPTEWPSLCGLTYGGRKVTDEFPDYNKSEFIRSIVEPGSRNIQSKFSVNYLTVENRILHYVVAHILCPRSSNFSRVSENDLFFMWVIRHRIHFNWPFYICSLMVKAQSEGPLPFPQLVSTIMRYQHVNDEDEISDNFFHCLNDHLLAQMKIKKIDGVWRRTTPNASQNDIPDAAQPSYETPTDPPADTSSSTDHTLGSILTSLTHLSTTMTSGFSALNIGISAIHARQDNMELRMKRMEDHLHIPPLPALPPPPPPSSDDI